MKHLPCLLLLAATFAGCSNKAAPGVVTPSATGKWTTIGGGAAPINNEGMPVYYFVDGATQTCWVRVGDALGSLDCCALRKIEEARASITWADDASCAPPVIAPPGA